MNSPQCLWTKYHVWVYYLLLGQAGIKGKWMFKQMIQKRNVTVFKLQGHIFGKCLL